MSGPTLSYVLDDEESFLDIKWRVKLYNLNDEGQWDDKGTGFVSITKENRDYCLRMTNEIDGSTLFNIKILSEFSFHRQRGTIITWTVNPYDEEDDTAVSFQEKEGVHEIWGIICKIKRSEEKEDNFSREEVECNDEDEILPEPSVENLTYIARSIKVDHPLQEASKVSKILHFISSDGGLYLRKLGDVMAILEKELIDTKSISMKETEANSTIHQQNQSKTEAIFTKNQEALSVLFTIFKYILAISDQVALEFLVSEEIFSITFGALENDYDSISSHKVIKHRIFLQEKSIFKNPFYIEDPHIIEKIKTNYRLTYLKDIVIGRFIEDNTLKNITIILNSNYTDIVSYITKNMAILKRLNNMLTSNDFEDKVTGVSFINELISITKDMYVLQAKHNLYEVLSNTTTSNPNFLESLEKILNDLLKLNDRGDEGNSKTPQNLKGKEEVTQNSILNKYELLEVNILNIFITLLFSNPNQIKNWILSKSQKDKDFLLINQLGTILLGKRSFGTKIEIFELFKSLLESDLSDKRTEFYDVFYNKIAIKFIEFLTTMPNDESSDLETVTTKQIILEIFIFCVKQHGSRVRYLIVHNDILPLVVKILYDKSKILNVFAVKFFRSIVASGDEVLLKLFVNTNCFEDIIRVFVDNEEKENMLKSTILDLFNSVYIVNSKILFDHLGESKYDFIDSRKEKVFTNIMWKLKPKISDNESVLSCLNVEKEKELFMSDDEKEEGEKLGYNENFQEKAEIDRNICNDFNNLKKSLLSSKGTSFLLKKKKKPRLNFEEEFEEDFELDNDVFERKVKKPKQ